MIAAVILAITEAGEESVAWCSCPADVDAREDALVAVMAEPVSWQTFPLAGLGGVEAVLLAGIVVGRPSHTQPLGLSKAATANAMQYLQYF